MRPPAASLTVSRVVVSAIRPNFPLLNCPTRTIWQARRESNPQPPVLETGALPIELLAFVVLARSLRSRARVRHFCSLCATCFRQNRQYLLSSMRSVVFFLFFVVL